MMQKQTHKETFIWRYNMGTAIVGISTLVVIGLIVRNMIKDKKAGKSIVCGGDCKDCGGHCNH